MPKAYEVAVRPLLSHGHAQLVARAITQANNWDKLEAKGVSVVVRPVRIPREQADQLFAKGQHEDDDGPNT